MRCLWSCEIACFSLSNTLFQVSNILRAIKQFKHTKTKPTLSSGYCTFFSVNRQIGRFAGFSLYVSNSEVSSNADIKDSTLCYKDSPPLPPLNFTAICLKQGRYVIYYNERLKGATYPTGYESDNVYTELCEVKVLGKHLKLIINNPISYILKSIYIYVKKMIKR